MNLDSKLFSPLINILEQNLQKIFEKNDAPKQFEKFLVVKVHEVNKTSTDIAGRRSRKLHCPKDL